MMLACCLVVPRLTREEVQYYEYFLALNPNPKIPRRGNSQPNTPLLLEGLARD